MKHADNSQINRSLNFSFRDGIFASGMLGFTQDYFAPFLLLLGGTARHIGMLSAIPNFFASLSQLWSSDLTERLKSRKKIINIFDSFIAVVKQISLYWELLNISSPNGLEDKDINL